MISIHYIHVLNHLQYDILLQTILNSHLLRFCEYVSYVCKVSYALLLLFPPLSNLLSLFHHNIVHGITVPRSLF